jgi:hypothetical protein
VIANWHGDDVEEHVGGTPPAALLVATQNSSWHPTTVAPLPAAGSYCVSSICNQTSTRSAKRKQASRQAISLYYSPLGIINLIFYPEAAPGGAAVAADAIDPEDVAARVHLHVVALGRRADLDPGVVQAALRGKTSPQSGHAKKSILKAKVDHHHLPGRCEEPDAAEAQVDDGAKEPAVAADVMPPQRREVLRHTPSSVARELAAHLEDAGGARAPHRQRKEEDEEHREEAGSAAGRRRHRSDRALGWHSIEAANR